MSDKFSRHRDKRINELFQRMRDSKLINKRKYKYWIWIFKYIFLINELNFILENKFIDDNLKNIYYLNKNSKNI